MSLYNLDVIILIRKPFVLFKAVATENSTYYLTEPAKNLI